MTLIEEVSGRNDRRLRRSRSMSTTPVFKAPSNSRAPTSFQRTPSTSFQRTPVASLNSRPPTSFQRTPPTSFQRNDVDGVRWNDVGALLFDGALKTGVVDIDL